MTAQQNYDIITSIRPNLTFVSKEISQSSIRIENLREIDALLYSLLETDVFATSNLVSNLKKELEQFDIVSNIDINVFQALVNRLQMLLQQMDVASEALFISLPRQEKAAVRIKLPDVKDFAQLSEISAEIQKVLSQAVFLPEINGKIEIIGVENGSIWVDVLVGSIKAVSIIGSLTYSAAYIMKERQKFRYFETVIEENKLDNKRKETLASAEKAIVETIIETEVPKIDSEFFFQNDPERLKRLEHILKSLSDLMQKGTEIHPSLLADSSIKDAFPNMKLLNLLQPKINKLKDSDNE